MNEAETRAELIDPKLKSNGWSVTEGSKILRERKITDGKIQAGGKRAKSLIADYILLYKGIKLAVVEAKYREAKIDLEQTLPNKYVVDSAEKAERKSYPIRWLIVSSSLFSTFLFSLILLLIFEKKKRSGISQNV
jgi:type I site-specific restriction endonuclease